MVTLSRSEVINLAKEYYSPSRELNEDAKALEEQRKFWVEEAKTDSATYNRELFRVKINEATDAIIASFLKSCDNETQKEQLKEKLADFEVGGKLREYLLRLTSDQSTAPSKNIASLLKDISDYNQLLLNQNHEQRLHGLELFPNLITEADYNCAEGTRDRLQDALKSFLKFRNKEEELVLTAHERVIEEYTKPVLHALNYDVHSKAAVEYSVGVNSEKTFAVSTYYEVSNEIALRNYVNYARDLNLEIKKILQEKKAEFELTKKEFQPKKGEIINFLESHPIQCEAEAVYYDAEGKAYKYNNIEQNYYALSVEIIEGKKTLRNDPDAIAQSKGSFVSPPISANQAFEEYLSALGLSLPEGAIYKLASDDYLHWKAREDLSAERFLEEVLLNDEWALVDVEISDPLENAAGAASGFVGAGATVTGESIQTQTAIDREKLLQVCSENENYSKAFNQVTQLINSENPELIEIGIWALYIKCRNINNTPLSHELNFINLIVDIGLNGKKLSEISNLEEAYERSILQLKSLLANYQADTSKEKDAINKLETIISRAECFRVQLIESGFDKVNLFLEIIRGEKELISNHLIQEDFDVNQTLANGATILMMAAKNGHEDVIKTLLDQKRIDVNKADIDGVTPLYAAARDGHEKVVKLLLAGGRIDVNKAATKGTTPLYVAANNGHEKVVKLLLDELRIDVNKATIDGAIPLHVAAELGHTEIVETLLSKGADISKAVNDGRTPLDLAKDLLSDKPKREKIIQAITRYQKVEKNIADDFIFSFRRLAGETTKLTAMTGGSKLVKKTQKESYRHFISTYGIDLAENLSHLNWQDIGDFMEDKPIGIAAERLFRVKVNTGAIDQETINKNLEGLLLYSLAKDIETTLSATEIPDKNFIKSLTAHLSEYLQEDKDEKIKSLPEEIKSVQEFLKNPDSRERSFSKEDSPQKNMEELMHIIFPINQAVGAGFGTVDDRAVVEDDGVGVFLNMSHRKNSTFSSSRQDGHDMAAEKSSDPSSVDIKKIEAAQLAENSVRRE